MSKTRPEERGEGGEEEEDDADGCEEDEGGGTPSPDTIAKAPASSPAKRPGSARASLRKLLRGKHLFCLLVFFFPSFSFAEYFHRGAAPQLANPRRGEQ